MKPVKHADANEFDIISNYFFLRVLVLLPLIFCLSCEFTNNDEEPTGSSPIDDILGEAVASSQAKISIAIGDAGDDELMDIAIDSSDNVYVTGYVTRTTAGITSKDVLVASYDSSGKERWTTYLATSSDEKANAIALDDEDNVYVTGYTYGNLEGQSNAGNSDIFLSKLNRSGAKQWTKLLGAKSATGGDPNPEIHEEEGRGVAVIGPTIVVVGSTFNSLGGQTNQGALDAFTAIFDANGNLLSVELYGTPMSEVAEDIVSNGTLTYIIGAARGGFNSQTIIGATDGYIMAIQGESRWTRFFGSETFDGAWGVAMDSAGNAYVAGHSQGRMRGSDDFFGGFSDAYVIKYSSMGTQLGLDVQGTTGNDGAGGVVVTSDGTIYAVGHTSGRVSLKGHTTTNTNIAIARYTSGFVADGTLIIGNDTSSQMARKIAVDSKKDLWIVGQNRGNFEGLSAKGGIDGFLLKLSFSLADEKASLSEPVCLFEKKSQAQTYCYKFTPFYASKTDNSNGKPASQSMCDGFASDPSANVSYIEAGGSCPTSGLIKNCDIFIPIPTDEKIYNVSFIGSGFSADGITCTKYAFGVN